MPSWRKRLGKFIARPTRVKEELSRDATLAVSYHGRVAKSTGEEPIKKDRPWLEKFYYYEPLLFGGINFYVHQVVGPGFEIKCDSEKERLLCETFAKNADFQSLLEKVQLDKGIFGNSFVEKLRNTNGELIGGVGIDAKSMDFIKDALGKVILDEMGQPVGYLQKLPTERHEERYNEILEGKGLKASDGYYTGGIPFSREDIAHYKLYSLSDTLMGVGLVEPLFDVVRGKMDAEEALFRGLKRVGQPLVIAALGSPEEGKEIPAKTIKKFSEDIMANIDEMKDITTPSYYKLSMLEPSRLAQLKEYLDYFNRLIASGLGIPHTILLGGERIGSKVADIQADNIVRTIRSYQASLARTTEKEFFEPLVKEAGLTYVPRIVFKTVSPTLLSTIISRLTDASRGGILTPDKPLEEWLRNLLGVPPIGEEDEKKSHDREDFRWKRWADNKGAPRNFDKGNGDEDET